MFFQSLKTRQTSLSRLTLFLLLNLMYIGIKPDVSLAILVSAPSTLKRDIQFFLNTNHINTLDEYAAWLKKNITYQEDIGKDVWTSPLQTLKRRYGDCDDFAFLTANILQSLNYKPKILLLIKRNLAHMICIVEQGGFYSVFDNSKLIKTRFKSEEALCDFLKSEYHYAAIRSINHPDKSWSERQIDGVLVSGS